jgi:hypothetical protein
MPNRKGATVAKELGSAHGAMLTTASRGDVTLTDLKLMRLVALPRDVILAAVVSLRGRGETWRSIGEALGTSAAAAHMRFSEDVRRAHSARSGAETETAG